MLQKRAVAWQERNGHFKTFCVPELWLLVLFFWIDWFVFFQLDYETNFSRNAEIRHSQQWNFVQERIPIELSFIARILKQFIQLNGRYLHNISNIQIAYQLRLIQIPEDNLHIWLDLPIRLLKAMSYSLLLNHSLQDFFQNRLEPHSCLLNQRHRLLKLIMSRCDYRSLSIHQFDVWSNLRVVRDFAGAMSDANIVISAGVVDSAVFRSDK